MKNEMNETERLKEAEELLQRCLDGFGGFVHGRKLARKQRDSLREKIVEFFGYQESRHDRPQE